MLFIKLSIGFFLLRLSNSKLYNWIIYVSLAIITVWSVVIFFWNVFQCSPVEAQWDYAIPNSKCVSPDAVVAAAYSISVMTILSDWLYVSYLSHASTIAYELMLTTSRPCSLFP